MARQTTTRTPAKRTTKKAPAKRQNSVKITSHRFFKPGLIAVFAVLFGAIGAYIIQHPFALDQNGVPRDQTQLVLEIKDSHQHAISPTVMPDYDPPQMLLFGDGTLVCGDHSASKKDDYVLTTGTLSEKQIDDLVDRVTKQGARSKDEKQHTHNVNVKYPSEATSEILLNYNSGAVSMRANADDMTATFKGVHGILTSSCAKYAKDTFVADNYVIRTQAVDPASVADLPEVSNTVYAVNPDGTYKETVVTVQEADQVVAAMGGAHNARLIANGKTYEIEVNPIMPQHDPITVTGDQDDGTVGAASDLKTKFIWFYPDGASISSLNDRIDNIHSGIRAFYDQETNRLNTTAGNQIVHGTHSVAWYNACHSPSIECGSDKDLNAYYNVRAELRNRGIIPNDATGNPMNISVNILAQWQSQHGSGYCSGWGETPDTIASSTGGFSITVGFGSTNWGCQASGWDADFTVPAHEMGHTFGLDHACSSSPNNAIMCLNGNFSWPGGYTITNSAQTSGLKTNSLFLNHQVHGRVYYKDTGAAAAGVTVTTCRSDITRTTNSSGYFSFRLYSDGSYCLRITPPTGYTIATKNNPEHATATSYEYQAAGRNCYHQPVTSVCTTARTTWDMSTDVGKDFILVKK